MNPIVENKVKLYPKEARAKFYEIRSLVFEVANENGLGEIEEALKWGQPSYLCQSGSTIRIDWQSKNPNSVDLFFNCKTILVETFKEIFNETLSFRGNRVVVVPLSESIPQEIETCILMALTYHRLKKLPLLGA